MIGWILALGLLITVGAGIEYGWMRVVRKLQEHASRDTSWSDE